MLQVGVDTGGTFTDFVWIEEGEIKILKIPSTPEDPSRAVLEGLKLLGGEGRYIVHGTTVATNALLERKGARTAFVTNEGFQDIIEIGRQNRRELYNLHYRKPEPLVGRELRFGLGCRVNYRGEIVKELSEEEIEELVKKLKELEVESVAVSFLHSYANPLHEEMVGEVLRKEGFYVSLSHEILREFREYERSSTTVINAYVSPKMGRYLSNVEKGLKKNDKVRVMQSNGGLISVKTASNEAVRTILSGPAGGVIGAMGIGKLAGYGNLITFDMGGTSTDVSLIDGAPRLSSETEIEGFPVKIPMIEIHTVGAGGGSIAHLDEGGALKVGPESAGADPGPVCYGRGERITTTDANLYLGRLKEEFFLGGNMRIHPDRTARYMERLSKEAGLDTVELAEGILKVANATMERAIRKVSIEKGYNPSDFLLFSFGGAGGLHAVELAKALRIPKVMIPINPGVLSALGMLMADIVKDYSLTVMLPCHELIEEEVKELFNGLEEKAKEDMLLEGFSLPLFERELDLRYKGQSFELTLKFRDSFRDDFHKLHERVYGYSMPDKEIELVNIRLRAIGLREKPFLRVHTSKRDEKPADALIGRRELIYEGKPVSASLFDREKLEWGNVIEGCALILEYSSTTLIPPGSVARVDKFGNLIVEVGE